MSGPAAPTRPTYLIRLRPGPDCRVPDAVALRRLLKVLGRVYGLECVGAWEEWERGQRIAADREPETAARIG